MATQRPGEQEGQTAEQGSSGTEQDLEQRSEAQPERRGLLARSPFSAMRRFSDEVDRMFADFFRPSLSRWEAFPGRLGWPSELGEFTRWPELEVHHSGGKLVIQADVPGLKKDDISVEVRDDEICIKGERRSESERREGRYYRTERTYGSFCRTVPLPEGAKPDTASASFENGVLRIEMEAPGGERGAPRRIEVREGSPH